MTLGCHFITDTTPGVIPTTTTSAVAIHVRTQRESMATILGPIEGGGGGELTRDWTTLHKLDMPCTNAYTGSHSHFLIISCTGSHISYIRTTLSTESCTSGIWNEAVPVCACICTFVCVCECVRVRLIISMWCRYMVCHTDSSLIWAPEVCKVCSA